MVQPSITQFCVQQKWQTPSCAAPILHWPVRQALIMKDTARERGGALKQLQYYLEFGYFLALSVCLWEHKLVCMLCPVSLATYSGFI